MNKKSEIKNFIGIYDNYITEEECKRAIELFENESSLQKTLNRVQFENAIMKEKKDEQFFAVANNLKIWWHH